MDLVLSEGAPVYGAITDNWPTIEPYFNETGKRRLVTCLCCTAQAQMLHKACLLTGLEALCQISVSQCPLRC